MRKFTFLKMMLLAVVMLAGSMGIKAQLLVENFDYTAGTVLATSTSVDATSGWAGHSGAGTNNITVTASSITYPGYLSSGVGNDVSLVATGEDVNKTFTSQTTGTVYVSFLVNVTSASTAGDYFFHVGPTSLGNTFRGRVFVKKDASDNIYFGISHSTSTVSYTSTGYALNTTYLVVLKYEIVSGTANDVVSIYINPALNSTIPSTGWIVNTDTPTDPADIGSVALRQGGATSGAALKLDGIRVSTLWSDIVGAVAGATADPVFTPAAGTYTEAQSVTLSSTTGAKIYYTTDGTEPTSASTLYTGAINVAATTTIKAIAYDASNANPSAVVSAVYTINTAPVITVTESFVPAMTAVVGATDSKTITVSGTNLTADISLAVSGANADQFSVSSATISKGTGTVTDQIVSITYTPTAGGAHAATLDVTTTGAAPVTRSLSGTATWPALAAPVAIDETGVSQTGFTANWETVSGATEYQLDVYTKSSTGSVVASDLFFSEYIEGSSNNKYLEIYNGTGADVDLSDYKVVLYSNGSTTPGNTLTMSGVLANGATYVIKNSSATLYAGTATESTVTYFNGDDAVTLEKISTSNYVDIIGRIGEDPGTVWADGTDATLATVNKTLVRKPTVTSGITINPAEGFPTLSTEWISYDIDVVSDLGSHTLTNQLIVTKTPAGDSPYIGLTGTSQAVTGLSNANKYYYTVVAKNANVTSPVSNEIAVALTATGLTSTRTDAQARAYNGKVLFNATAGESVEIYNTVGQKLVSTLAVDGLNEVPVRATGVLVVKVSNRVSKVIL